MNLTPKELHYFKRELIAIELRQELWKLRDEAAVEHLLATANPQSTTTSYLTSASPFLQYIFKHVVLEFPLLKRGPHPDFWLKCQEFFTELPKLQLDTYTPKQSDAIQRRALIRKLERTLLLLMNAGLKTVQGEEESIRVTPEELSKDISDPVDTPICQHIVHDKRERLVDATVVSVRGVLEKRAILSDVTRAEYIIKSSVSKEDGTLLETFVARRFSQFQALHESLKSLSPSCPAFPARTQDDHMDGMFHEGDRLNLRAYLRRVIAQEELASSTAVLQFLNQDPIQLTDDDRADIEQREALDAARAAGERQFREELNNQVVALHDLLEMLKKQVLKSGGLIDLVTTIKMTENLSDLPDPLKKMFEWGRINFAFTLYTHFIACDASAENIATLKRTHALIPYRTIAMFLRFSNPMAMVKGVVDLFLAQPFGGRSLLQRIIISNMTDDGKLLQKRINKLEAKIEEKKLCEKIAHAVRTTATPLGLEGAAKHSIVAETIALLRKEDIEPVLEPELIAKVAENTDTHEPYRLAKRLYRLWTLRTKQREQELLLALAFQNVTGEILKEVFTLFYQPIAQVYKSANISDSIHHFSAFISDLIELIDATNVARLNNSAMQGFIDLVQRHEQNFYQFVHKVHAQDASHLFEELVVYVDRLLASIAQGILPGRYLNMDEIMQQAGVDEKSYPALRNEIEALIEHRHSQKVRHLERMRQKMMAHTQEPPARAPVIQTEQVGIMHDLEEIEYDEEGDTFHESDSSQDEAEADDWDKLPAPEPPVLKIIPKVVPTFVNAVARFMDEIKMPFSSRTSDIE